MPVPEAMRRRWENELRAWLLLPGGSIALVDYTGWEIPGTEQPWVGDVGYTWTTDRELTVYGMMRIGADGQRIRIGFDASPRLIRPGDRLESSPIDVDVS